MANNRRRSTKKSSSDIIGGHWLPSFLIWGGVLLMLTGGVIAYPTINGYLTQPEAASLEFSVTLTPAQAVVAVEPTTASTPVPTMNPTEVAPPPVVLPETELLEEQTTPTPTPAPAEEQATPEATPEPTNTPSPTPTLDPASLLPSHLFIPAIDLDAPVVQVGWDTKEVNGQLVSSWIVPNSFAAGWHVTSALPGNPGNTVLNGHHNIYGEVFRDLEDLEPGDEIVVYAGDTPHYYSITERHILKEKYETEEVRRENARFILPTEDERLTLVTCWPYTNNTHRLVIVALPMQPTPAPTPMLE
jgi:LPXTG-site transpeptidase (sortase) family protein